MSTVDQTAAPVAAPNAGFGTKGYRAFVLSSLLIVYIFNFRVVHGEMGRINGKLQTALLNSGIMCIRKFPGKITNRMLCNKNHLTTPS